MAPLAIESMEWPAMSDRKAVGAFWASRADVLHQRLLALDHTLCAELPGDFGQGIYLGA